MRKKYAVYREVLWFFFRHENPTITYTQVYKLLLNYKNSLWGFSTVQN